MSINDKKRLSSDYFKSYAPIFDCVSERSFVKKKYELIFHEFYFEKGLSLF